MGLHAPPGLLVSENDLVQTIGREAAGSAQSPYRQALVARTRISCREVVHILMPGR